MRTWLSATVVLVSGIVAGVLWSAAGASLDSWSAATTIPSCATATQPKVVFPFSAPNVRSGPGAILWLSSGQGCAGAVTTIEAASIGAGDQPGAPRPLLGGAAAQRSFVAPLAAIGTTEGNVIAIAGQAGTSVLGAPEAVASDGPLSAPVERLRSLGGPDSLVATMNGFIGDADVATVAPAPGGGYEIVLRAQRHYARSFSGRRVLPVGSAKVTALALGMDFRADRLVLWVAGGELYAQYVSNEGRIYPRQTLGASGYRPQVAAVVSDDRRAFVLWTVEPPPDQSAPTRVLLAHSGFGPTFHGAQTLASFTEPAGVRLTPGAVAAERLSGEGVALLWPAMVGGNYVIDAAGATQSGALPPSTIALAGADVRLGAVATGPANEVVVIAASAPRTASGFDQSQQQLLATRSNEVRTPNGLGLGPLEVIAPAGPNTDPSVSVDPSNDTAVAAWQTLVGGVAKVAYAIGAGATTRGG